MKLNKNKVITKILVLLLFVVILLISKCFHEDYECRIVDIDKVHRSIAVVCQNEKIFLKVESGVNINELKVGEHVLVERYRYMFVGEENYFWRKVEPEKE